VICGISDCTLVATMSDSPPSTKNSRPGWMRRGWTSVKGYFLRPSNLKMPTDIPFEQTNPKMQLHVLQEGTVPPVDAVPPAKDIPEATRSTPERVVVENSLPYETTP